MAALLHKRQSVLGTEEVALQIHVHYPVPILLGGVPEGLAQGIGGVVKQHVYHAVLLAYSLEQCLDLAGIADIRLVEPGALSQLLLQSLAPLFAAANDHDLCAPLNKETDRSLSDSAGTAGDHRHIVVEIHR